MELIKGYPDKIIIKTSMGNTVTISCGQGVINVDYLTKTDAVKYVLKETKQEKLLLNLRNRV